LSLFCTTNISRYCLSKIRAITVIEQIANVETV